jgi:hypothetical protein
VVGAQRERDQLAVDDLPVDPDEGVADVADADGATGRT